MSWPWSLSGADTAMSAVTPTESYGWRVLAAGVMALGLVALAQGDFDPGQPVPRELPGRTVLAYAAALFMLGAGAALAWRRTVGSGAAALAGYYALIVVLWMNGRVLLAHYREYGAYSGAAEQLAIAAAALVVYAASARTAPARAARLTRAGQVTFAVCVLLFGGAHFAYLNLTAPLVPRWLPPGQQFWAYATGLGQIAAGVAILTRICSRLAAILLTAMYVGFAFLVHLPMLLAAPLSRMNWSENALNLALTGAAWVIADSLSERAAPAQPAPA